MRNSGIAIDRIVPAEMHRAGENDHRIDARRKCPPPATPARRRARREPPRHCAWTERPKCRAAAILPDSHPTTAAGSSGTRSECGCRHRGDRPSAARRDRAKGRCRHNRRGPPRRRSHRQQAAAHPPDQHIGEEEPGAELRSPASRKPNQNQAPNSATNQKL